VQNTDEKFLNTDEKFLYQSSATFFRVQLRFAFRIRL